MNHRRLALTQTDSRAFINLGSMHVSPHNQKAFQGTWMQSCWSGWNQWTFWPKTLIDSLKIIHCTNPFFNADLVCQSTPQNFNTLLCLICFITSEQICAKKKKVIVHFGPLWCHWCQNQLPALFFFSSDPVQWCNKAPLSEGSQGSFYKKL